MLTAKERERYDRQIMIDEIGEEGQQKLKKAKVFVAGAGGLGSPVSMYLATAGVGLIRIVDHDTVNLSNLNRQILHWDKDIGRAKVESATDKLRNLNPDVKIEAIWETITPDNVCQLVADADLIVDAMVMHLQYKKIINQEGLEL
jgi:adenylyltransferase/sulfurtransferase